MTPAAYATPGGDTVSAGLDLERRYGLHPQLALRTERFGALLYHYGNRRLTFLKSPELTALVEDLERHESAAAALDAHGVQDARRPAIIAALTRLRDSEVICAR